MSSSSRSWVTLLAWFKRTRLSRWFLQVNPIKRKKVRVLPWLFLAGLVALVVWAAPARSMIQRFAALPNAPKTPVTFLLAGVSHNYSGYHTRAIEDFSGLTDTMIVVQLNPQQHALKLLSVPRDTRVGAGTRANDKINAAILGGPEASVRAIEGLLGVPINGYLLVSIDGSKALVNALGGIDIFVPEAMEYSDTAAKLEIHLKPGLQHLNGTQAEGFLRFRHDNLGDIGRTQRQQAFMRALLERLKSPAGILALPGVATAIEANTRTNLTRQHVGMALGFLLSRPRTDTLLLPGDFGRLGGKSFWLPNNQAIQNLVVKHLRGTNQFEARDVKSLSVAVVAGDLGLQNLAISRLRAAGFQNVFASSSNPGNPKLTTILSNLNLEEAKAARSFLGVGESLVSGEGVLGADLTIKIGQDFALLKN
jgi:polyisoprenyl-teichoic acid--peptidoglycan teichoic acid transferase